MPIVLSFSSLGVEMMAGIPEFVKITTNISAIIYYTLDGSLPTSFSTQYSDPIKMPTDVGSITLSAVAYYTDGYGNLVPSQVLTKTYAQDTMRQGEHIRPLNFQGLVYMYPGGKNIPFWYDAVGEATVFIDISKEQLLKQIKVSDRNSDGSKRDDGEYFVVEKADFTETVSRNDDPVSKYADPNLDEKFDPNALVIVVDGREQRNMSAPAIINGPHMSLRDPKKNFGGVDFISTAGSNNVSGSLTKYHYNREKGIIVFYYRDSNTGRSVKSIQTLPEGATKKVNSVITNPVVFKWNNFGRHQGI